MIEPIMPTNVSYEVTTIAELSVVIAITWWGVSCLIIFWVDPRPTYTEMMKHIVKTFFSGKNAFGIFIGICVSVLLLPLYIVWGVRELCIFIGTLLIRIYRCGNKKSKKNPVTVDKRETDYEKWIEFLTTMRICYNFGTENERYKHLRINDLTCHLDLDIIFTIDGTFVQLQGLPDGYVHRDQ